MRLSVICLLFMACTLAVYAGTDAATASIASSMLFSVSDEQVASAQLKSPGRAFVMSLVVPGTGQLYVGKKRGILQLVADVGLITAHFLVRNDAQSIEDDYVAYVRENVTFDENDPTFDLYMANLPNPSDPFSGWNMEDFEHATQTNNWHYVYTEENGQPTERTGPFYWKDLPENFRTATREELKNAEVDSADRQQAYDIRDDANSRFKLARTILGITIANHLVAAIDARIAAMRHNNQQNRPTFSLRTTFEGNQVESRLVLEQRF